MTVPLCNRCDGALWVCEAHDNLPWDGHISDRCPGGRMILRRSDREELKVLRSTLRPPGIAS